MQSRDRLAAIGLIAFALLCWAAVAWVLTTRSPEGDVGIQLAGSALTGLAAGVSAAPLAWLAVFARHRRIAYHGDWTAALRRGLWVGLVVGLLVALRTQDALSLPIALFVLVMVAFVEASLSVER